MTKVSSMTGFGQGEAVGKNYTINIELKSVNHRFKDVRVKIPSLIQSIPGLEYAMKKRVEESFKRGSFDLYLNYKRVEKSGDFVLDHNKIKKFVSEISALVSNEKVKIEISPTDFLRKEFAIDEESEGSELKELTEKALAIAIGGLQESRKLEGEKLVNAINSHLDSYKEHFSGVSSQSGLYKNSVEERLRKKLAEFQSELKIDDGRFLQEVVYYLEKLDVNEEISRINSHLEKITNLLGNSEEVGREIDFFLQELGRETNTIGSKSGKNEISDAVVQMKVQLEKIREQSLNLE